MSRRTETAYKAGYLGKSAPHDEVPWIQETRSVLRLCSDSSRSYPGRSAPLCTSQERLGAVKVAVMEQKSAEAIVDKDSTTHGGVVAGNEPG